MGTVLRIFQRDIVRLIKNPFALVVIVAMSVLPALYAWYCIEANWDPYEHTNGLHIAVANEDIPTTVEEMGSVDVGGQIVDQLSQNSQFTWEFVSKSEAIDGVKSGRYYAAFIIPSSLSADFTSALSGDRHAPHIDYYVNEKYSSTAVKVTDEGSTAIERQVDEAFSEAVSEALIGLLKDRAGEIESQIDTADGRLSQTVTGANEQVAQIIDTLQDVSQSIDSWSNVVDNAQETLDALETAVPQASTSIDDAARVLAQVRSSSEGFSSSLAGTLTQSGALIGSTSSQVNSQVSDAVGRIMVAKADVDSVLTRLQGIIAQNDQIISQLQDAAVALPAGSAKTTALNTIARLQSHNDTLRQHVNNLSNVSTSLGRAALAVQNLSNAMNTTVQTGAQSIMATGTALAASAPRIGGSLDSLVLSMGGLSGAVSGLGPQVEEISSLLSQAQGVFSQVQASLSNTESSLGAVQKHVDDTVDDIRAIASALEADQLSVVLGLDVTSIGEFMSSPVTLDTEVLYPVEHYGAAVAPFYTNLAIWVGCFMLIAILKMEVDRKGFESMTAVQAYMARWLLFVLVSLVQTAIICIGDVALGIGCVDPISFVIAGLVTSFAFVNVVFMLGITLKHIGKALAVLLLIMQIPGSSGMYPIEMMPPFFQQVHPLLPFTYGISAMREAIGGMYGGAYAANIVVLLLIAAVSLLIGLFVRPYVLNLNVLFDKRLRETTYMVNDDQGLREPRYRVRNVVRALLDNDEYRSVLLGRATRFNRRYPSIAQISRISIIVLPLAVLVIMCQFSLGPNGKVLMIVGFVTLVVLLGCTLVLIEYFHDYLNNQVRMVAHSGEDLMADVMGHTPLRHKDFSANHAENVRAVLSRLREAPQRNADAEESSSDESLNDASGEVLNDVSSDIPGKALDGASKTSGDASGASTDKEKR